MEEPKEEKPEKEAGSDNEPGAEEGDIPIPGGRGDKKFKKAMSKMGLKTVTGINRVGLKKGKNFTLTIEEPDVWKFPGSENSYVVFGKPNLDSLKTGESEMSQLEETINVDAPKEDKPAGETATEEKVEGGEEEDLDESKVSAEAVQMVMNYTKCTKAVAIKALIESGNDSVNAIMKLTG